MDASSKQKENVVIKRAGNIRPYDRLRTFALRGTPLKKIAIAFGMNWRTGQGERAARELLTAWRLRKTWEENRTIKRRRKKTTTRIRHECLVILENARTAGLRVHVGLSMPQCRIAGLSVTMKRVRSVRGVIQVVPRKINVVLFGDGTWRIVIPNAKATANVTMRIKSLRCIPDWPTIPELAALTFQWGELRHKEKSRRIAPRTITYVKPPTRRTHPIVPGLF